MKKLILFLFIPQLLYLTACENNYVSGDSYVIFDIRFEETVKVKLKGEIFRIRLIDVKDQVWYNPVYDEECGLYDENRIFVSIDANGLGIKTHSEIGGPDNYEESFDIEAERIRNRIEDVISNGYESVYLPRLSQSSSPLSEEYNISLECSSPQGEDNHDLKEDYKFIFVIYPKSSIQ